MTNITLIPSIKEHYKDQFELCVDFRLIRFIKKTFSKNAKIYFSIKKAKTKLGYHSRPAIEGLKDAVDWFNKEKYQ